MFDGRALYHTDFCSILNNFSLPALKTDIKLSLVDLETMVFLDNDYTVIAVVSSIMVISAIHF